MSIPRGPDAAQHARRSRRDHRTRVRSAEDSARAPDERPRSVRPARQPAGSFASMRADVRATLAIVSCACVLPLVPAGASAASRTETLVLDSHEGTSDGAAGPVTTTRPLADRRYSVTVRGTFSFYGPEAWAVPAGVCGVPEPRPLLPGGAPSGPVGFDAETIFALPATQASCARVRLPRRWANFELALGRGWGHPRSAVRAGRHAYRYVVRGRRRRARFRLVDSFAADNYGRLEITVRALRRGRAAG